MVAPLVQYHPHRLLLEAAETRMSPTNKTNDSFHSEESFDSNMVIVLAALLCALFFALGINSAIRCCLRCGYRFAFEIPDDENGTTGLKRSTLIQIPVVAYASGLNIPATDCAICIGEFEEGEKVRILPKCNHGFHIQCIDAWLVSHRSCPLCRQTLLEQETSCHVRVQLPENATAHSSLAVTH